MAQRKDAKKKPRATAEDVLPLGRVRCSICGKDFDDGEIIVLTDVNLCEKCYDAHVEKEHAAAIAETEAQIEADGLEAEASAAEDSKYDGPESAPPAPREEAAGGTPVETASVDTPTPPPTQQAPPTAVSERIRPGAAVVPAGVDLGDSYKLTAAERERISDVTVGPPARRPVPATPNWFAPRSVEEALAICKLLFRSRLLPDDIKNPEAAFMLVMAGAELGFKPTQSLRFLYLVNGRPALMAGGIMAIIAASPECEYFEPVDDECDETKATYRTKRRGRNEQKFTFTAAAAERAGLPKRNPTYRAHPQLMYHARAQATLGRRVYPDLLGGYYLPDEVAEGMDLDERPTTSGRYEELRTAIETAPDLETLRAMSSEAAAAVASGTITQAEFNGLAETYEAQSAALKEEK